ncbi:hypothetical protein VTN96DRAFT_1607 [Rasamsonia emersonii]
MDRSATYKLIRFYYSELQGRRLLSGSHTTAWQASDIMFCRQDGEHTWAGAQPFRTSRRHPACSPKVWPTAPARPGLQRLLLGRRASAGRLAASSRLPMPGCCPSLLQPRSGRWRSRPMAPNQPRARDSCHASVSLAPHLGSIPFLSFAAINKRPALARPRRSHSSQGAAVLQRDCSAPVSQPMYGTSIHARCRTLGASLRLLLPSIEPHYV